MHHVEISYVTRRGAVNETRWLFIGTTYVYVINPDGTLKALLNVS
jgi:hypothetical protein